MQTQEEASRILETLQGRWGLDQSIGFTWPALFLLIICAGVILLSRRHAALAAAIWAMALIPMRNQFIVVGFNFHAQRIIILLLLLRIIMHGDYTSFSMKTVDKLVLWFAFAMGCATLIRNGLSSFPGVLGGWFDLLLPWFALRMLLRDLPTLRDILPALALLTCLVASLMVLEKLTTRNILSFMGAGYGDTPFIRDGKVRSQISFGHPITAGTFGSIFLPMLLAWAYPFESRCRLAILSCVSCLIIVLCSASSGPLLSCLAAVAAMFFWRWRHKMSDLRKYSVLFYIVAEIVMTAPAYALLWRVTAFGGSTGYHRYQLMDGFVKHFNEWWFCGTNSTAHWGYFTFDVANQLVGVGIVGGIIPVLLYIGIFTFCFKSVGQYVSLTSFPDQLLMWSLGASMFAIVLSFMGVSYFDQLKFIYLIPMVACHVLPSTVDVEATLQSKTISYA